MRPTENELIKAEIEKLHKRNSGDYQLLLQQTRKKPKVLSYNLMQMLASEAFAKLGVRDVGLEVGRGGGKTTVLADALRRAVEGMPRAKGMMLGATFKAMDENSLPGLKHALELQGLYEGLHYFDGKRPPAHWNWDKTFQAPKNYDRMWTFYTGTGIQMFSMEGSGEGRGPNAHFRLSDEFALLDGAKVSVMDTAVRAPRLDTFINEEMYLKKVSVSTTPLDQHGAHFLAQEQAAILDPSKNIYIRTSYKVNQSNLPEDYGEVAERKALFRWMFEAEYLSIRPSKIKNGFYAQINKAKHTYSDFNYTNIKTGESIDCLADNDCDVNKPLTIGIDWGANINCLVVLQDHSKEIRTLKEFFVKAEDYKIQDDMINDFIDYYKPMMNRTIFMYYDNTGNNATGNTRLTRAAQASTQLRRAGFSVQAVSTGGRNPLHYEKYLTWEMLLSETDSRVPKFRLNHANCPNLWISMTNAKAKLNSDKSIGKDKSSERSKAIKREHATDLSDAIDAPIYNKYFRFVRSKTSTTIPENC